MLARQHSPRSREGLVWALLHRAGAEVDYRHLHGNEWCGESLTRICCGMTGTRAIDPGTAYYGSSDFAETLQAVSNKLIVDEYLRWKPSWQRWCSVKIVDTLRPVVTPHPSAIRFLEPVDENVEYGNLLMADDQFSGVMLKYGGKISLTLEAIANDDLDVFGVRRCARAAARTVDRAPYQYLDANPNLSDGFPLFDSFWHSNVINQPLNDIGIRTANELLSTKNDQVGNPLGQKLTYVIADEDLRVDSVNASGSVYETWETGEPEIARLATTTGEWQPVITEHLASTVRWYAMAERGTTMEIVLLRGHTEPQVFVDGGWTHDALHWKVRLPFGVYAKDFNSMVLSGTPD
jgi:hypothetical protein